MALVQTHNLCTIVTQKKTVVIDCYTMNDIYGIFAGYYEGNVSKASYPIHQIDYKLYELLSLKLRCCDKPDCDFNKMLKGLLAVLEEEMRSNNMVLFSWMFIPEGPNEITVCEMVRLINAGFQYEEAQFLITAGVCLEVEE